MGPFISPDQVGSLSSPSYNPFVSTPAAPPSALSYTDAALIVKQTAATLLASSSLQQQNVPLLDALGRVLASPVTADRDQPPFRRATRDGFACRAADVHAPMKVVGRIRAGDPAALATPPVSPGEAVEIMTGAPVPEGADCVLMVEHITERPSSDGSPATILLDSSRAAQAGDNIVPSGAEARRGAMILETGTRLAANHIGAAAACGYSELPVYLRSQVAVLATGDELVELSQPILPYHIRNSNSYSLAAQIALAGGEPHRLPIAKDDKKNIEAAIRVALSDDLVLLSGGVSAGRFDFVEEVLLSIGAEFLFTGVLIQPGRPLVFGRIPHQAGHRYFFGLPGNPVSTLVTFALFVRPVIEALAGVASPGHEAPRFVQARLAAPLEVKPGLTRFLPANLRNLPPFESEVATIPWQGSGDLASTAKANCYLVIPPERGSMAAGETVSVLLD
ncbi:MAG TPA: gephyrin-like molybdotransferase Glp [Acidisarcina sp.]